jgi:hypothetical protein
MLTQQAVELDIGLELDLIDHPQHALGFGYRIGGRTVFQRQPQLAANRRLGRDDAVTFAKGIRQKGI